MVEYNYDKNFYLYNASQYFAIAFTELFGGKVCLWLDKVDLDVDKNSYKEKDISKVTFYHAFSELTTDTYVDSVGLFNNIYVLEENFKYYDCTRQIIITKTLENTKEFLNTLKVPFKDTEIKRNVREYLRNNILTFSIQEKEVRYNLGLIGRKGNELNFVEYNNGCFNNVLHSFDARYISTKIKDTNGFQPCPQWYYKRK